VAALPKGANMKSRLCMLHLQTPLINNLRLSEQLQKTILFKMDCGSLLVHSKTVVFQPL